jgi:hypothetical protein
VALLDQSFKNRPEILSPFLSLSLALFIVGFGIDSYIDSKIEGKLENPAFINKVAKSMRPSVIFDINGSILSDMGAMQYIEDIKVDVNEPLRYDIIVSPKKFLSVAPILECLDEQPKIIVKRGKKFDWIYELYEPSRLVVESPEPPKGVETVGLRFRIEVIKQ